MTGHDHSAPEESDAPEDIEAVELQRIRYNPSSTPTGGGETERIRYNPSRKGNDS